MASTDEITDVTYLIRSLRRRCKRRIGEINSDLGSRWSLDANSSGAYDAREDEIRDLLAFLKRYEARILKAKTPSS